MNVMIAPTNNKVGGLATFQSIWATWERYKPFLFGREISSREAAWPRNCLYGGLISLILVIIAWSKILGLRPIYPIRSATAFCILYMIIKSKTSFDKRPNKKHAAFCILYMIICSIPRVMLEYL
jgi:hypothetical protein